ncbi:hypothetical protein HanXRQr2_Chr05g0200041 [Helianthus annuus]|uniref:Uncharacterized protein n=1 Tax=Helianthus annuus TaxID=4232 RepID=A0A9K3IXR8_HELAN|nr:hypothetical protein HanXRQr2_Chr05g0200041 [Helianthus annuus]
MGLGTKCKASTRSICYHSPHRIGIILDKESLLTTQKVLMCIMESQSHLKMMTLG